MKTSKSLFRISLALLVSVWLVNVNAQTAPTFYSQSNGNWSNPAVWNSSLIPGSSDNVVINHNITVDMVFAECLDLTVNSTGILHEGFLDATLDVYGEIENHGSIHDTLNVGNSLTIDVHGNLLRNHSSGNWENTLVRLYSFTGIVNVEFKTGSHFTVGTFCDYHTGSINALSDLKFENTNIYLSNHQLNMNGYKLQLIEGALNDAVINSQNGVIDLWQDAFIEDCTLMDATLSGVLIVEDVTLSGNTLLQDSLYNRKGMYPAYLTLEDDFVNEGVICNHPSGFSPGTLLINVHGDITNNRIWENQITKLNGTVKQHIYLDDNRDIAGNVNLLAGVPSGGQWYHNGTATTTGTIFQLSGISQSDLGLYQYRNGMFGSRQIEIISLVSCQPVQNFIVARVNSSGAILQWSAVSGALAYDVWYRNTGSTLWKKETIMGGSVTFLQLSGLTPSSDYECKIRAVCGSSSTAVSPWSPSVYFFTGCSAPVIFDTHVDNGYEASLYWQPGGGATGYEIEYTPLSPSTSPGGIIAIPNPATSSYLLTGLTPLTKYVWRIRSNCVFPSGQQSAFSAPAYFGTQAPKREIEDETQKNATFELSAFPNPATDKLTLRTNGLPDDSEIKFSLLDLSGKEMWKVDFNVEQKTTELILDINDYENGAYYVIADNGIKREMKLVIFSK